MTVTIRNKETGETLEVSQEMFDQQYSVQGYEIDTTGEQGLEELTRDQLNAKAAELGVEAPEKMANKAEVTAAIEEKQSAQADANSEPSD